MPRTFSPGTHLAVGIYPVASLCAQGLVITTDPQHWEPAAGHGCGVMVEKEGQSLLAKALRASHIGAASLGIVLLLCLCLFGFSWHHCCSCEGRGEGQV